MIEELIRLGITIITFSIAAINDWRTREVNPYIWIPSLAIGLFLGIFKALNGLTIYQIISLVISLVIVCSVAILVFVFKLMGGADFLAITSFITVYPYTPSIPFRFSIYGTNSLIITDLLNIIIILPPILSVLLVYTIVMMFFLIYNIVHNMKYMNFLNSFKAPLHRKLYFILFHRIIDIDVLFKERFYYPIFIPGRIERRSFDVYEDDLMWREKLKDMPRGTVIVVSWGIPMVTFFSISIFIYLMLYLIASYTI